MPSHLLNISQFLKDLMPIYIRVSVLFGMEWIFMYLHYVPELDFLQCNSILECLQNFSGTLMNPVFPSMDRVLYFVMIILGLLASIVVLTLENRHLWTICSLSAAAGVITCSYVFNQEFVQLCLELFSQDSSLQQEIVAMNIKLFQEFLNNCILQTLLALIYIYCILDLPFFPKKNLVGILFIYPTIINAAIPFTSSPVLSAIILFYIVLMNFVRFIISKAPFYIHTCFNILRSLFRALVLLHFHLLDDLCSTLWTVYNVSKILLVYTLMRLSMIIFIIYGTSSLESGTFSFSTKQTLHIFHELIIESFGNVIAIFSIASVISDFIDENFYRPLQNFIIVPENERKSISRLIFALLIILCIHYDIPSLNPEKRLLFILKTAVFIFSVILNQINEQLCNVLINLSVVGNLPLIRHCKVVFVTSVVFIISFSSLIIILNTTLCSLEVSVLLNSNTVISIIFSFIIYFLNMFQLHREKLWLELPDYTFYIESAKNIIIFMFNIVYFVRTFYYFFYESVALLKILLIVIHVYSCLWCKIVSGCKILKERQMIADCVNSLLIVSDKQIQEVDDLCIICFDALSSHMTCKTNCNHFFHVYCLKHLLHSRKSCVFCRSTILDP